MQTVSRCAYALASYDKKTQNHDIYTEKKASLEECCNNIRCHIKLHLPCSDFVAVNALYSKEKNISLCCYKNTLFIGFQDKNTKQISLDDRSNSFVFMSVDSPEKLQERMINALSDAEKGRPNIMSQQLKTMWKPLLPVLDKIVEQENEFKKLPVYAQESLTRQAQKEAQIEKIITNMLGGVTPEQGNVNSEREEEKKERLVDTPLSKRFSEARKEAEEKRAAGIRNTMDKTRMRELVQ